MKQSVFFDDKGLRILSRKKFHQMAPDKERELRFGHRIEKIKKLAEEKRKRIEAATRSERKEAAPKKPTFWQRMLDWRKRIKR